VINRLLTLPPNMTFLMLCLSCMSVLNMAHVDAQFPLPTKRRGNVSAQHMLVSGRHTQNDFARGTEVSGKVSIFGSFDSREVERWLNGEWLKEFSVAIVLP
jgi:hypothetical protein